MVKISGKVNKSKTFSGFNGDILFGGSSGNKERNITSKPVVSLLFIHFSAFYYLYIYIYIYIRFYMIKGGNPRDQSIEYEFSLLTVIDIKLIWV